MCPRLDAFNDNVAHLLVVVTPVEVTLLSVVKGANIADQNGVFQLRSIQPTKYTVPSDNLTFLAVAGSCTGRLFLAGSDCNLYAFEYKNAASSCSYFLGIGPDFSCKKRKYNCATGMRSFCTFFFVLYASSLPTSQSTVWSKTPSVPFASYCFRICLA